MKTTVEISDDVFRQTKATAALRGESLREFITEALRHYLDMLTTNSSDDPGWRRVFGTAASEEIETVDATIAQEFNHVDSKDWS